MKDDIVHVLTSLGSWLVHLWGMWYSLFKTVDDPNLRLGAGVLTAAAVVIAACYCVYFFLRGVYYLVRDVLRGTWRILCKPPWVAMLMYPVETVGQMAGALRSQQKPKQRIPQRKPGVGPPLVVTASRRPRTQVPDTDTLWLPPIVAAPARPRIARPNARRSDSPLLKVFAEARAQQRVQDAADAAASKPAASPLPIVVAPDNPNPRKPGELPLPSQDKYYWLALNECVDRLRALHVPYNARQCGSGAVVRVSLDRVVAVSSFSTLVKGKQGWTSQPDGTSGPLEVYVTADAWEVVGSYLVYDGGKVEAQPWRLSSTEPGKSYVTIDPRGDESGITVEAAYYFVARWARDLTQPRF